MKRWRLVLVSFIPLLLSGCGLFIAPRNEIEEVELAPVVDGWIDEPTTQRDFAGLTLQMTDAAPSKYILLLFDVSDIPLGAQILSARLSLYCVAAPAAMEENDVLRIKEPWDPDTVVFSWDAVSYENQFDMDSGAANRLIEIELGKIVQSWVNGALNYGIALATISFSTIEFQSTEAADQAPLLRVRYYF